MKQILQITLLFFIVNVLFTKVSCSNDSQGMQYELINDYVKANNLKICVVLSCNKVQDRSKLLKILHGRSDFWYSFYDLSSGLIELETLLMRLSHHIGVVLDLNCKEIVEFLREISKRTFFHHERYWLMFSRSMNYTFNVLQTQNINADAEISVAVPIGDRAKK